MVSAAPVLGKTMMVKATAYDAQCKRCGTGKYTRTGTIARRGIVAVDSRVIPYGSRVHVPGYAWLIAEDSGGAIKGRRTDICFGSRSAHKLTSRFGVRRMRIKVISPKR